MIMGILGAASWLKNAAWTAPSTNSLADIFSAWSHHKATRHSGAGQSQAAGPGSGPASGAASLGAGAGSSSAAQAQSGLLQVQGAAGAALVPSLSQAAINQAHAAYRAHASAFSQAAGK